MEARARGLHYVGLILLGYGRQGNYDAIVLQAILGHGDDAIEDGIG